MVIRAINTAPVDKDVPIAGGEQLAVGGVEEGKERKGKAAVGE